MESYLIILRKKGNHNREEYKELWLPTTTDQIEERLNELGCRFIPADYDIAYANFGYPVIDQLAYDSDILALNRLGFLLQDIKEKPAVLCAELIYMECRNIHDVIYHLLNRPELLVFEKIKDLYSAGEMWFEIEYYLKDWHKHRPFEEYIHELEHCGDDYLCSRYIRCAMENLRHSKFRFTPYGLVCQESNKPLPF